jgi:hypothetical protein
MISSFSSKLRNVLEENTCPHMGKARHKLVFPNTVVWEVCYCYLLTLPLLGWEKRDWDGAVAQLKIERVDDKHI